MRRSGRTAFGLGLLLALCAAAGVASAGDAGETCRTQQLAAAKKLYKASLSCWAKGFKNPSFDPLVCLVKPEQTFQDAYLNAARMGLHESMQRHDAAGCNPVANEATTEQRPAGNAETPQTDNGLVH